MNLVGLSDDLKNHISQYLSTKDYASLMQTCNPFYTFCSDPLQESVYWKKIYEKFYSSKKIVRLDTNENPWKDKIKLVEEELKKEKIFSKKFQICLTLKCEKLGSLRKELKKTDSRVLTVCLRDLVKNSELDSDVKIKLAENLIAHGADPLQESNVYLDDYPLKVALLNNENEMISLFIKLIPKNKENKQKISELIDKISKNSIINVNTSVLSAFNI